MEFLKPPQQGSPVPVGARHSCRPTDDSTRCWCDERRTPVGRDKTGTERRHHDPSLDQLDLVGNAAFLVGIHFLAQVQGFDADIT